MKKQLHINGKAVSVDKVDESNIAYGFISVYVNNFSSCHNLPAEWFNAQEAGCTAHISGNVYSFK